MTLSPNKHADAAAVAEEAAVVEKAVAGDRAALAELLRRFGPVVRQRIAPRISKVWQSVLEPDDVMQVTYMEAFLNIGRFKAAGPGAFTAWLSRMAENNLLDAVKELERAKRPDPRRRVRPARTAEDSYVALVEMLGVTTTTPSRNAARGEIQVCLDGALSRLTEDYATVIRLYDLQGLSALEVSERMKRSQGAVFMLLARARERLREVLGAESQFFSQG
jgi:RNA polymerase sigma-70 factor, ECF subfamily